MTRTIWLPITEAKCSASACSIPKPCARRDIPQDQGRPRADYSQSYAYGPAECKGPNWLKFIPHSQAVKPVEKQEAREWIGR